MTDFALPGNAAVSAPAATGSCPVVGAAAASYGIEPEKGSEAQRAKAHAGADEELPAGEDDVVERRSMLAKVFGGGFWVHTN